jgi:hypothetical protein
VIQCLFPCCLSLKVDIGQDIEHVEAMAEVLRWADQLSLPGPSPSRERSNPKASKMKQEREWVGSGRYNNSSGRSEDPTKPERNDIMQDPFNETRKYLKSRPAWPFPQSNHYRMSANMFINILMNLKGLQINCSSRHTEAEEKVVT